MNLLAFDTSTDTVFVAAQAAGAAALHHQAPGGAQADDLAFITHIRGSCPASQLFYLGVASAIEPIVELMRAGIDVAIDKQTHLTVTGIDRQLVGQVAADIRSLRKPDPYKQKGVRYTGEVLKKKAGKTGAK